VDVGCEKWTWGVKSGRGIFLWFGCFIILNYLGMRYEKMHASRTWKAMESNRFPHVFRKKKGSHF
jgi:hypothetical protein